MASVAEQLRQAREQLKLSVYDVAPATKIRTDHVRALDQGAYDVFAAPVYIRGFVRTYATLVKLDVSQVMRDLEAELSASKRFSEPPHLGVKKAALIDSIMLQLAKVNWQLMAFVLGVVLVAALAVLSYRAWSIRQSIDPLSNLGPGLYDVPQTNAGELLPLPSAGSPRPER